MKLFLIKFICSSVLLILLSACGTSSSSDLDESQSSEQITIEGQVSKIMNLFIPKVYAREAAKGRDEAKEAEAKLEKDRVSKDATVDSVYQNVLSSNDMMLSIADENNSFNYEMIDTYFNGAIDKELLIRFKTQLAALDTTYGFIIGYVIDQDKQVVDIFTAALDSEGKYKAKLNKFDQSYTVKLDAKRVKDGVNIIRNTLIEDVNELREGKIKLSMISTIKSEEKRDELLSEYGYVRSEYISEKELIDHKSEFESFDKVVNLALTNIFDQTNKDFIAYYAKRLLCSKDSITYMKTILENYKRFENKELDKATVAKEIGAKVPLLNKIVGLGKIDSAKAEEAKKR